MIECQIELIAEAISQDEYGQEIETETATQIFANVQSASASEFFQGYQNGIKPAFTFLILSAEYHGEQIVRYNGLRYSIYRRYRRDIDHIELHCEQQEGTKS